MQKKTEHESVDTVERERERAFIQHGIRLLDHTQYNLKNSKNENILTDVYILIANVGII